MVAIAEARGLIHDAVKMPLPFVLPDLGAGDSLGNVGAAPSSSPTPGEDRGGQGMARPG